MICISIVLICAETHSLATTFGMSHSTFRLGFKPGGRQLSIRAMREVSYMLPRLTLEVISRHYLRCGLRSLTVSKFGIIFNIFIEIG